MYKRPKCPYWYFSQVLKYRCLKRGLQGEEPHAVFCDIGAPNTTVPCREVSRSNEGKTNV